MHAVPVTVPDSSVTGIEQSTLRKLAAELLQRNLIERCLLTGHVIMYAGCSSLDLAKQR